MSCVNPEATLPPHAPTPKPQSQHAEVMGLMLPLSASQRARTSSVTKSFSDRHWSQFYNLNFCHINVGAPVLFYRNVSHSLFSFVEGIEARVSLLVVILLLFCVCFFANFVPPHKKLC